MKTYIEGIEDVLLGLSFLDDGRNLIPVYLFITALFTKMDQNSENFIFSRKKEKKLYILKKKRERYKQFHVSL